MLSDNENIPKTDGSSDPEGEPSASRRQQLEMAGSALLVLVGVSLYLTSTGPNPWFRWLGVALAMFGMSVKGSFLSSGLSLPAAFSGPQWGRLVVSKGSYIVVFFAAMYAFWPMSVGDVPISQDHAQHYLQSRIFVDDFLSQGRLFGWTDKMYSGVPFGDSYPHAVYLIPSALHVLTFGLIDLGTSYALGVFSIWLALAFGVTALTRYLLRSFTDATFLPATIAGILVLTDVGGEREGGWVYSHFHAVWPQLAGTAAWVWGLLLMFRLTESLTVARLSLAALVMGFGLWFHPWNAMLFAVAMPLLVVIHAWAQPSERVVEPRRASVWLVIAGLLSVVIGLGWLSHVVELPHHDTLSKYQAWASVEGLVSKLIHGRLFDNGLMLAAIAAVAGLVVLARRRSMVDWFVLMFLAVILVMASGEVPVALDLGGHETSQRMLYRRYAIAIKPLYFACAGVGFWVLGKALFGLDGPWLSQRPTVGVMHRLVAAFIAAPLVVGLGAGARDFSPNPTGKTITLESAEIKEDIQALTELLREEVSRHLADAPVLRVFRYKPNNERWHYELFAIADAGLGENNNKGGPATMYRWKNATGNPALWRLSGATLLITTDAKKPRGFREVGRAGDYRLLRLQEKPAAPVKLHGSGSFEVVEWEHEYRRIALSGVTDTSALVIAHPKYHKWHAAIDGEPVEMTKELLPGVYYTRIDHASGLRDGELVLEYRNSSFASVALGVSLALGLLLVLLAALLRARPLPHIVPARWLTGVPLVAGVGLAVFMAIVLAHGVAQRSEANTFRWLTEVDVEKRQEFAKAQRKLGRKMPLNHSAKAPDPRRDIDGELLALLHHEAYQFELVPEDPCFRSHRRDHKAGCRLRDYQPRLAVTELKRFERQTPTCLRFVVPDKGEVALRWPIPEGANRMRYYLHKHGRVDASLRATVALGDLAFDDPKTEKMRFGSQPQDVAVGAAGWLQVTVENTGDRVSRLCLELAALRLSDDELTRRKKRSKKRTR